MGRFYETTFFDDKGAMRTGWQLLAGPVEIADARINYAPLVEDFDEAQELTDPQQVLNTLGLIGDAAMIWNNDNMARLLRHESRSELPADYLNGLLNYPAFAVEASPLSNRGLGSVLGLAGSIYLVRIGVHPAIVLIGDGIGIVVIRGLGAVSGAVWDGVRGEVVDFSADVAAKQFEALRQRLGVKRLRK